MKYVRILRENVPAWGIVEEETVYTLSAAPFSSILQSK